MISKRFISAFLWLLLWSTTLVEADESTTTTTVDTEEHVAAAHWSGPPQKESTVLPLTDESFEHATQASTGQTTGSWLVWFHGGDSSSSSGDIAIRGTFPTLDEWLEQHVVVASVNVDAGGFGTATRLQVNPIPSFVLIHKGKMYPYPVPQDGYSWEAIAAFCRAPDPILAKDVPPPPSLFEHLLFKVSADKTNLIVIGGMIMVMVLGLFFGAVVGHFGTKHKESLANKKSKDD